MGKKLDISEIDDVKKLRQIIKRREKSLDEMTKDRDEWQNKYYKLDSSIDELRVSYAKMKGLAKELFEFKDMDVDELFDRLKGDYPYGRYY